MFENVSWAAISVTLADARVMGGIGSAAGYSTQP
jgi:hypothetical protein